MPRAVMTSFGQARLGWLVGFRWGSAGPGTTSGRHPNAVGPDRVGMRVIQKLPDFRFRIGSSSSIPCSRDLSSGRRPWPRALDQGRRPRVGRPRRVRQGCFCRARSLEFCTRYIARFRTILGVTTSGYLASRKKGCRQGSKDFNEASVAPPYRRDFASGTGLMLCGRGAVWLEQKDFDRAIADFSMAIELDPSAGYPVPDSRGCSSFETRIRQGDR